MRRRNSGRRGDVHDLGDQLLAAVVARVGLAGEDELHRPVLVVDDGRQPVEVAEEQGAALVGGEAAGEADRQRLGVEHLVGAGDLGRRGAAALELRLEPARGRRRPAARGGARASATARRRGCGRRASRRCGRSAVPPTGRRGSGRRAGPCPATASCGVWTPLVIEVIGTSASGSSGQMACHIFRDTWPCSLLTPLVTLARRRASTVMQNGSLVVAWDSAGPGRGARCGRSSSCGSSAGRSSARSAAAGRRRCRPAPACAW